ncbi:MAG TPA: hypothetical protein DIT97_16060 [Gimesia maris]|uniref:Uncharacterized protein n=1 Tax=Gimesia maris TaxID=122 RepID=A0A3D3R8X6_9PLAN|nr:hypothetical protein [Gimesia maris]|tara:strand:+ start:62340 stop:63203 length:864 start_codon:yes stop_codon:yes gene_type:complete
MIRTNATVKIDPFTPPCWRWEVAEQLFNEPGLDKIPEDRVTRDALTYLRTGDSSQFPDIHTSRQIFVEDGLRRAELEARILVGQTDAEIAELCKYTPELVQVYADLFFCVRDFPKASDWKLRYAVGKPHFYGYQDHNLRQMWNWFGLTGESLVLNHVIQAYYDELRSDDEPTLSVYLRPSSSVDLRLQGVIADGIFPNFQSANRWELEFAHYSQLINQLHTQEEKSRALQQYKKDRIRYVYQYLKGKIKSQPPKRTDCSAASRSPAREIRKIQERLRSLELGAPNPI